MADKTEEKLEDALLKVALGYQLAEVTEEYAEVNGEFKLTKRKKTKKDVPPDLKAVQMLLLGGGEEYGALSDEELEREKERLLTALKDGSEEKAAKGKKSTAKKPATKKKTVKKKTVKKGE